MASGDLRGREEAPCRAQHEGKHSLLHVFMHLIYLHCRCRMYCLFLGSIFYLYLYLYMYIIYYILYILYIILLYIVYVCYLSLFLFLCLVGIFELRQVLRVDSGPVLLVAGRGVHALDARCGHRGAPLEEGWKESD